MLTYSFVPLECIFIDFSSEAVIVALVVFIPLSSIDQWLIWSFICIFFHLIYKFPSGVLMFLRKNFLSYCYRYFLEVFYFRQVGLILFCLFQNQNQIEENVYQTVFSHCLCGFRLLLFVQMCLLS